MPLFPPPCIIPLPRPRNWPRHPTPKRITMRNSMDIPHLPPLNPKDMTIRRRLLRHRPIQPRQPQEYAHSARLFINYMPPIRHHNGTRKPTQVARIRREIAESPVVVTSVEMAMIMCLGQGDTRGYLNLVFTLHPISRLKYALFLKYRGLISMQVPRAAQYSKNADLTG